MQDLSVQHRSNPGNVVDHAGYTASTRQHELDHIDHTDHTDHTDHDLSTLKDVQNDTGIYLS